ncbi:hypothetical protein ACWCSH_35260, partial [Streptosporangium sp. NPDC001682]
LPPTGPPAHHESPRMHLLDDVNNLRYLRMITRPSRIAEHFEVPLEVVFSLKPFPRLGSN